MPKGHSQGDTYGDELSGESSSSNDDAIAEGHGQVDVDDVIVLGTELATNEKAEDYFMVGQYVVARYDGQWHIAVVEGEELDGEEMNIPYSNILNVKKKTNLYGESWIC